MLGNYVLVRYHLLLLLDVDECSGRNGRRDFVHYETQFVSINQEVMLVNAEKVLSSCRMEHVKV